MSSLNWKSFHAYLASCLRDDFTSTKFADVTLVCDEQKQFQAHKFVLSSFSPILKNLLVTNPHPHPIIYLRGIKQQELEYILQFMYLGEAKLYSDQINILLDVANDLHMKGLANVIRNEEAISERKEVTSITENRCKYTENNERSISSTIDEIIEVLTPKDDVENADDDISYQHISSSNDENVKMKEQETEEEVEVSNYQQYGKEQKEKYSCELCEFQTVWSHSFRKHTRVVHGSSLSCNDCEYQTVFNSELKKHKRNLHGSLPWSCNQCQYKTKKHSNFQRHKLSISCNQWEYHTKDMARDGSVKYNCDQCDFQTAWKSVLINHMQTIHSFKLSCNQCKYQAKRPDQMEYHQQAKHGDVKYYCDQCDYLTTSKITLKRHQTNKHAGFGYFCNQCDFKTNQGISYLRRHKEVKHEGIKYFCSQCNYQSPFKNSLTEHKKNKHEGIKYYCDQCEHVAITPKNLKNHVENKHEGVKYFCDQCDYQTGWQSNLNQHKKAHHSTHT